MVKLSDFNMSQMPMTATFIINTRLSMTVAMHYTPAPVFLVSNYGNKIVHTEIISDVFVLQHFHICMHLFIVNSVSNNVEVFQQIQSDEVQISCSRVMHVYDKIIAICDFLVNYMTS